MNDAVVSDSTDGLVGNTSVEPLTAGAMLRSAREAAGLHVAALAVSMKVPVKKLEALEADKLDLLLEAVFVRALASSVCRALKIDATPVLERLPQNRVPRLNASEAGINAPFHVAGHKPGVFLPAYFAKPGFFVVLALLVGVAVVVLFPEIKSSEHFKSVDRAQVHPAARSVAADAALPNSNVIENVSPNPAPESVAAQAADVVVEPPTSATDVREVERAAVGVASAEQVRPAIEQSAPVAATTPGGLVLFKAKGSSWVEVVDGKGVVQLRRILPAGETIAASGALPLAVVVGRADAVDVAVRGKAFDLTGVSSKDNVARFEVK